MRNFLVTTKTGKVLIGGEAMGKGIAVDEGSHKAKKKAIQKLALPFATVKPCLDLSEASCRD
jgi:hypothetical protein